MLTHKFWKKYFEYYDILNQLIPYQELIKKIVEELNIKNGDYIFEAGAGTGNLSVALEYHGAKVMCFDYSSDGLELCKNKIRTSEVMVGDLTQKLSFPDNYFDKVCSNNVLYTFDENSQKSSLRELYRILKPGGMVVISNLSHKFRPFEIYVSHVKESIKSEGLLKTVWQVIKLLLPTLKILYYNSLIRKEYNSGTYNFFEPGEQKKLLSDCGFSNVSDDVITYSRQAILNKAFKK